MAKTQNIRVEKKSQRKPFIVDMEVYKKMKALDSFKVMIQNYRHIVIIGRNDKEDEGGCKAMCFSTMTTHDLLWTIEQIKQQIL